MNDHKMTQAEKYEEIRQNLGELNLKRSIESLDETLDQLTDGEITLLDAFLEITRRELRAKKENSQKNAISSAGFPFIRTLEEYDFDFQPSLCKEQVLAFRDLRFMEKNQNIILSGNSGTGKTHIAVAIGLEAAKSGRKTYFIESEKLLKKLWDAYQVGRDDDKIKYYVGYKLLIIDAVAYTNVRHKIETQLLYRLISRRHALKRSTIITTISDIRRWAETFEDADLAEGIFNKLADNRSPMVRIIGPSYTTQHMVVKEA